MFGAGWKVASWVDRNSGGTVGCEQRLTTAGPRLRGQQCKYIILIYNPHKNKVFHQYSLSIIIIYYTIKIQYFILGNISPGNSRRSTAHAVV